MSFFNIDTPTFENPVFTTPTDSDYTNDFGGTLETKVICSMHLPTHSTFKKGKYIVFFSPNRACSIIPTASSNLCKFK